MRRRTLGDTRIPDATSRHRLMTDFKALSAIVPATGPRRTA